MVGSEIGEKRELAGTLRGVSPREFGCFESWTVPLAAILPAVVPVCGALVGIAFVGLSMNLYCQLALALVIAMFMRTALRFVAYGTFPSIVALSAAAVGLLPLVFASGAGSAACGAIGITAVCGLVSACVGLLFVPVLSVRVR